MRLFQNTVFRIKKLNKDPPVISGVADWRRASSAEHSTELPSM